MLEIKFYEDVKDELLRFAVIIAKHDGHWVFCKHKEREETGAAEFEIKPICVYSVTGKTRVNETGEEAFGGLFYAEIASFGEIHSEMEKIVLTDTLPENWTYPEIQPALLKEAERRGFVK